MEIGPILLIAVGVGITAGCVSHHQQGDQPVPLVEAYPSISLAELPSLYLSRYKVDPYIRAAGLFQSMGRDNAIRQLRALSQSDPEKTQFAFHNRARIAVLCRMLCPSTISQPKRTLTMLVNLTFF